MSFFIFTIRLSPIMKRFAGKFAPAGLTRSREIWENWCRRARCGRGSRSRAFYARPVFVAHILNLQKLASMPQVFPAEIVSE
ncbi:MAG: hypothetical protein DMF74_15815 [Acidobacteria bacterium]|nr:MAG: hypothetical protein DMF74_15815 [Acidobacteriota bacterium]